MKKYLYAGALAACLASPAFAANNKLAAKSPDEPLHRRTVVICVVLLVGLSACKRRLRRDEPAVATYRH
jgi:hypothetical protein